MAFTLTTVPAAGAIPADPDYGTASIQWRVDFDGTGDLFSRLRYDTNAGGWTIEARSWPAGVAANDQRGYTVALDGAVILESSPDGRTWTEVTRAVFTLDHGASGPPPVLPPLPDIDLGGQGCELVGLPGALLHVEAFLLPYAVAHYDRPADPFGRASAEYRHWADVTRFVRDVQIDRVVGSDGTATVTIDNRARFVDSLSPSNASSVGIYPMTPMRVSVEWAGRRIWLFHGFVDGASYAYVPSGQGIADAAQTIRLTDAFKELAGWDLGDDDPEALRTPMVEEAAGVRIARWLDLYRWAPDKRVIDPGVVTLQPAAFTGKALDALRRIEASEFGVLFVAADDSIVFHDRRRAWIDPKPIVAVVTSCERDVPALPGVPGAAPRVEYADVVWAHDDANLANHVEIGYAAFGEQFVIDVDEEAAGIVKRERESIWRFGLRSWAGNRNDLLVMSNRDLDLMADLVLEGQAFPAPEFRSAMFDARTCRRFMELQAALELRVALIAHLHLDGMDHSQEVTVQGISHTLTADPTGAPWTTTLTLARSVSLDYFPIQPLPPGQVPPAFRPPNVQGLAVTFRPFDAGNWKATVTWAPLLNPSPKLSHVEVTWRVGGQVVAGPVQVPLGATEHVLAVPVAPGGVVEASVRYIVLDGAAGTASAATETMPAHTPAPTTVPSMAATVTGFGSYDWSWSPMPAVPDPSTGLWQVWLERRWSSGDGVWNHAGWFQQHDSDNPAVRPDLAYSDPGPHGAAFWNVRLMFRYRDLAGNWLDYYGPPSADVLVTYPTAITGVRETGPNVAGGAPVIDGTGGQWDPDAGKDMLFGLAWDPVPHATRYRVEATYGSPRITVAGTTATIRSEQHAQWAVRIFAVDRNGREIVWGDYRVVSGGKSEIDWVSDAIWYTHPTAATIDANTPRVLSIAGTGLNNGIFGWVAFEARIPANVETTTLDADLGCANNFNGAAMGILDGGRAVYIIFDSLERGPVGPQAGITVSGHLMQVRVPHVTARGTDRFSGFIARGPLVPAGGISNDGWAQNGTIGATIHGWLVVRGKQLVTENSRGW